MKKKTLRRQSGMLPNLTTSSLSSSTTAEPLSHTLSVPVERETAKKGRSTSPRPASPAFGSPARREAGLREVEEEGRAVRGEDVDVEEEVIDIEEEDYQVELKMREKEKERRRRKAESGATTTSSSSDGMGAVGRREEKEKRRKAKDKEREREAEEMDAAYVTSTTSKRLKDVTNSKARGGVSPPTLGIDTNVSGA